MLKSINKRYNLKLRDNLPPTEQRLKLVSDILKDSTFFPKTVEYKDIDEAFTKWVEEDLRIVFEDEVLPTYALFSNQRFTEYMQMWENVDENRNVKMNFKVITRENNPKDNMMYGKAGRIPTNEKFLMKRIEGINDQGKKCYIDYKMSQPVTVDLIYRITLITNKYELVNKMNTLVRTKFSTIQSYLNVKEHLMPMKLQTVSDDSEYAVDDRQYLSQMYEINLMGYILGENDFEIEVNPVASLRCIGIEGEKNRAMVEIEDVDDDPCNPKEPEYQNQKVNLTITYNKCDSLEREFVMDSEMIVENISLENIRTIRIKINDEIVNNNGNLKLSEGDVVNVRIKPINKLKNSKVLMEGYNPEEFLHKTEVDNNLEEIEIE